MSRTCAFAALISCCCAVVAAAPAAESDSGQVLLSREETVELFEKLHAAVAGAKTFRAKLHRTEEVGFIEDAEPLEFRGEVQIERPSRFRQEIKEPRRSLIVISDTDLWVYFPEGREVQHVDLRKGIKDREGTVQDHRHPQEGAGGAGRETGPCAGGGRRRRAARRARPARTGRSL